MIQLPEILNIPPKLYPLILRFSDYMYFLLHGGRGGAKSHSVGRLILFLCEKRKIRVVCGREQQNSIDESVYTLLVDLINQYNLNFSITKNEIIHNQTGSTIHFRGFFERGRVNIKGLEGVDIVWIDEAQAISQAVLDVLIPTIRKAKSKIIFTMNRNRRNDPVFKQLAKDKNCLTIQINYFENPHCSEKNKAEAEKCKKEDYKKYRHVWCGDPEDESDSFLFPVNLLDLSKEKQFAANVPDPIKSMAVDLSGRGGDLCVATLIEQRTYTEYELTNVFHWNEKDTVVSEGRIIHLFNEWKPDLLTVDADGMGYPIYCSLRTSIPDIIPFYGGNEAIKQNCLNQRADGYLTLREFLINRLLKITDNEVLRQLEYIKKEYSKSRKGLIKIQAKIDMKKEQGESPDFADSTMMNVYAINYHSNIAISKRMPQTSFSEYKDEYGW